MNQRRAKLIRKACGFKVHKPRVYGQYNTKRLLFAQRNKDTGVIEKTFARIIVADERRQAYQNAKKAYNKKG